MMDKILRPIRDEDIIKMASSHSGWTLVFQVRGGIDKIAVDFYRNPSFARKLYDKISKACQNFTKVMVEADIDVLARANTPARRLRDCFIFKHTVIG